MCSGSFGLPQAQVADFPTPGPMCNCALIGGVPLPTCRQHPAEARLQGLRVSLLPESRLQGHLPASGVVLQPAQYLREIFGVPHNPQANCL